eukprot:TRINITY_DN17176_c0_g2_i1.p1 TRINITY_DN17176_c0_g2~~TRINITY_DN17176_c0_g2_i1.p1  ORF type:complete len:837 (-),score=168.66 TRINITY_DN17176_c0_g2_i1:60-2540(-)
MAEDRRISLAKARQLPLTSIQVESLHPKEHDPASPKELSWNSGGVGSSGENSLANSQLSSFAVNEEAVSKPTGTDSTSTISVLELKSKLRGIKNFYKFLLQLKSSLITQDLAKLRVITKFASKLLKNSLMERGFSEEKRDSTLFRKSSSVIADEKADILGHVLFEKFGEMSVVISRGTSMSGDMDLLEVDLAEVVNECLSDVVFPDGFQLHLEFWRFVIGTFGSVLKRVRFQNCKVPNYPEFTKEICRAKSIEILMLVGWNLNNDDVRLILRTCKLLRCLDLSQNDTMTEFAEIDPESIPSVGFEMTLQSNLQCVKLRDCRNLKLIDFRMPALHYLNVSGCTSLERLRAGPGNAPISFYTNGSGLSLRKILNFLDDYGTPVNILTLSGHKKIEIKPESGKEHLPLYHLYVENCDKLENLNIFNTHLSFLSVRNCSRLSVLIMMCPRLLSLDLSFCNSLVYDIVKKVVQQCFSLRSLRLEGWNLVPESKVLPPSMNSRKWHEDHPKLAFHDFNDESVWQVCLSLYQGGEFAEEVHPSVFALEEKVASGHQVQTYMSDAVFIDPEESKVDIVDESPCAIYEDSTVTLHCASDLQVQILSSYISFNDQVHDMRWRCLCSEGTFPAVCSEQLKSSGLFALKNLFDPTICSNVTTLDLTGCGLHVSSLMRLIGHLMTSTLKSLSLKAVGINDSVTSQLCGLLENNRHLMFLNLSRNFISSVGIQNIVPGLKKNITLEHLDVSFNPLQTAGLKSLLSCIRPPSRITRLMASYCEGNLSRDRPTVLSLLSSSHLSELNLTGNRLAKEDLKSIDDSLTPRKVTILSKTIKAGGM